MKRLWIKTRVPDTEAGREVANVLTVWATARDTPYHMIRAIRLYVSLLRGETDVLNELFPFLLQGQYAGYRPKVPTGAPVITVVERSAEDSLAEFFDSTGLDVEF